MKGYPDGKWVEVTAMDWKEFGTYICYGLISGLILSFLLDDILLKFLLLSIGLVSGIFTGFLFGYANKVKQIWVKK